jgi:hypothetical protein
MLAQFAVVVRRWAESGMGDMTFDPKGPLPQFGGVVKEGFNAAFADGTVHFIPSNTSPDTLRALITRAGGKVIDWPDRRQPPSKAKVYLPPNVPPGKKPAQKATATVPPPAKQQ